MSPSVRHARSPFSRSLGFTIIELAVVLVIVALLIGSFLYPLSTQVDQRNTADTQRRLEDIREALIGFAIANGRLPCPATVSSPPSALDSGIESGNTSTGLCTTFSGYVPGRSLGLNNLDSQGFALDAWGSAYQSRIRYAVTNANLVAGSGTTYTFTGNNLSPPNSMRVAGTSAIGSNPSCPATTPSGSPACLLYVCLSSTGITASPPGCGSAANALSNGDAVFVIYSAGKNLASEQSTTIPTVFVSQAVPTSTYDDQVLWVSRFTLISRLVLAGQLP